MPAISGISHIDITITDLERSERWYAQLFGASRVLAGRNDDHHFTSRYLLEPSSLLLIGLVQHDQGQPGGFNERSVGLDHLAFNVDTREDLDSWMEKLDELHVDYDLNEGEQWDVVVLRDPDGVQLEFFLMKADPASFIAAAEAVV